MKDGKLEGEYVQNSEPFFQTRGQYIVTNPQYVNGRGDGFPPVCHGKLRGYARTN